jgi:hypothetical protein
MTHIIQKYFRITDIQPVETAALIGLFFILLFNWPQSNPDKPGPMLTSITKSLKSYQCGNIKYFNKTYKYK